MASEHASPDQFVRIDLRFSGSFLEMDSGDIAGLIAQPNTLTFECDDDEVIEDLADALEDLGQDPEALVIVDVEGDGLRGPEAFDAEATQTSGWPRFKVGARFTRFLAFGAPADEAALRAVREAFSMATVRAQGHGIIAYDESPSVTVNVVTDPEADVDLRPPHERRSDGLVGAINAASKSD
ncbi:MAG: hypothetical protein ACPGU1_21850 [Myxococcota bacterium]